MKITIDLNNKYSLIEELSPLDMDPRNKNHFFKRDNLNTTHRGYGGTKLRKLEYLLYSLKERYKVKSIKSYGAYGSNHLLTLTYWCRQIGIPCDVVVWKQPIHRDEVKVFSLTKKYAHSVKWISSWQVPFLPKESQITNEGVALIPIGGDMKSGAFALLNGLFELNKQIDLQNSMVVTAAGTCATVSGLAAGAAKLNKNITIVAVNVSSKFFPQKKIIRKCAQSFFDNKRDYPVETVIPVFGGVKTHFVEYGRILPNYETLKKEAYSFDLTIDPTYTSKSFRVYKQLTEQYPEKKIIYWHSKP